MNCDEESRLFIYIVNLLNNKKRLICTLIQHAIIIVFLILFTDKKTHVRFLKIKIYALSQFFVYYLKGPLCVDTCIIMVILH